MLFIWIFKSALYKIDTSKPDPKKSFTTKKLIYLHRPYGFTIYLVSRISNEHFEPIYYRAKTEDELENVLEKLFSKLEKISKFIAHKYNSKNQIPMNLTEEKELNFKNAEICHICERELKYDIEDDISNEGDEADIGEFYDPDVIINERYKKVRDHCHLSGKCRGAAHNECNMNLKLPQNIPIFCHNMSGYNTHV